MPLNNLYSFLVDLVTNVLMTIDYAHHEVHSGSHYFYRDSVELGNAGVQDYLITTPNTGKWGHWIMEVDGSAITAVDFYEGSDKDGTAAQTIFNSNRNSLNTAGITIHKGTSGGTTDGTKLYPYKSGAASAQSKTPSSKRNDDEIVLKQNTKYIIRVTSGTAANLTNVYFSWYEHTNKN